jgi:GTPase SAR1 family protein
MWSKVFKTNRNYNILILGLANAGKTTLLYQMYAFTQKGHSEKQSKQHLQLEVTFKK